MLTVSPFLNVPRTPDEVLLLFLTFNDELALDKFTTPFFVLVSAGVDGGVVLLGVLSASDEEYFSLR